MYVYTTSLLLQKFQILGAIAPLVYLIEVQLCETFKRLEGISSGV